MSRIPRKSYDSLYFHVIVQGFEKNYIFKEDCFKKKYLYYLLSESKKYKVEILSYCIMENHAHILLYCDKISEMSKYMQSINTRFAMLYNKKNSRVGYVFRDRYLSEPIRNENYLLNCVSYIHMNPVNANMVDSPDKYAFSSYNNFINKSGIVNDSVLKKLFGSSRIYMPLFNMIHGTNIDTNNTSKASNRLTLLESKKIINDILNKYFLIDIDFNQKNMAKFFIKKFLDSGVKIYHLEKIFKLGHHRIKRIIEH